MPLRCVVLLVRVPLRKCFCPKAGWVGHAFTINDLDVRHQRRPQAPRVVNSETWGSRVVSTSFHRKLGDLVDLVGGLLAGEARAQAWMTILGKSRDVKSKMSTGSLLGLLLVDSKAAQVDLLTGEIQNCSQSLLRLTAQQKRGTGTWNF